MSSQSAPPVTLYAERLSILVPLTFLKTQATSQICIGSLTAAGASIIPSVEKEATKTVLTALLLSACTFLLGIQVMA
jgi:hypothetical protein